MTRPAFGANPRSSPLSAAAFLVAVLAAGSMLLLGQALPAEGGTLCAANTTTVCVVPATQSAMVGTVVNADVVVDGVSNLGAFQFTVGYDPAILVLTTATLGSFISSSGRSASCLPPNTSAPGVTRFVCVTLGAAPPPGASGSGVLYSLQFSAIGGGSSSLALSNVILTDPAAAVIPSGTEDGAVSVSPVTVTPTPTETPCAGPCPSSPTPTSTGTPTPTPPLQGTVVSVDPPAQSVDNGGGLVADIRVANVTNLGTYQFTLNFSGALLTAVEVLDGGFVGSTGRSVLCPAAQISYASVTFACATFGAGPGASGSGILASVVLTTNAPGTSELRLSGVGLGDPLSAPLPFAAVNGSVTIIDVPAPTSTACPGGVCPTPTPPATPTPTATPVSFPVSCSSAGTVVCVQPVSQAVSFPGPGSPVSVGVVVANVTDLGAFQFTLNFDPAIVSFGGLDVGDFLGSTGRQVQCATPAVTAGSVTLACGTLGGEPPAGPSGTGLLAVVHLAFVGSGTTALQLTGVILTTPSAVTIPSAAEHGSLSASLATPTPCPGGICPTPTDTPTPTATPTPFGLACPPAAGASMCVVPASQTAPDASTFTVQVVVNNVTNLGAYEFELAFDPGIIAYVSVANADFLGSTGRTVACPAPILGPTSVRFGCVSQGTSPPAPSGSGALATVTFVAAAPGTSPLTLALATLSDPLGSDIPVTATGGQAVVQ